jgi:DNA (cytosine-5)-methyltransferase 1
VDLFAGIGGLRAGFSPIPGTRCVFTSEWNPFAQKTYRANYGDDPIAGDIREAHDAIPAHDLLLAGFPCQPFSIAGVSKKNALGRPHGFACEAQGTLFFEVAKIIARHQPAAFLLENVKNLKSHDRGNTYRVIIDVLTRELGYTVSDRVVDAKAFVPQHRERIFLVGFRRASAFDWSQVRIPTERPVLGSILHPEDGTEAPEAPYTDAEGRVADRYTLTPNLWKYLQDYAAKHRQKGNGFGFGLVGRGDVARTLSARYHKDGSEILISRGAGNTPRRLTPRECARLMGYPAGWRIPVSDTQAYRQFGNSVVVPVVSAIAAAMAPHVTADAPPADGG